MNCPFCDSPRLQYVKTCADEREGILYDCYECHGCHAVFEAGAVFYLPEPCDPNGLPEFDTPRSDLEEIA